MIWRESVELKHRKTQIQNKTNNSIFLLILQIIKKKIHTILYDWMHFSKITKV